MQLIILALILCMTPMAFGADIPLTVTDSAGITRTKEPVSTGIPFALADNITTTSVFGVFDGATEIPAQFTVLGRWHGAPSDTTKAIRWVLVEFQADCAANSSKVYTLKTSGGSGTTSGMSVIDGTTTVTVNTGEAEYVISKTAFNIFDRVRIKDPANGNSLTREVVSPGGTGPYLTTSSGSTFYAKNRVFTSSVERQGPLHTVVLITGKHRDSGGADSLSWKARVHFYHNKSFAKVDYTVTDIDTISSITDYVGIDQMVLPVVLNRSGDTTFTIAGESANSTGSLTGLQTASLLQTGSIDQGSVAVTGSTAETANEGAANTITYALGGQASGSGGHAKGWVDLSDSDKGITTAVRYFWQLYPKKLEVSNNGTVAVHLWPSDVADMRFFCAAQKTHEILYYFHNGSASAAGSADLAETLFGVTTSYTTGTATSKHARLWPIASASQYSGSRALGYVGPRNTSLYPPDQQSLVTKYYTYVDAQLDRSLRERDTGGTRGGGHEYMMWSFGDSRDDTWSNMAYDTLRASAVQFAASGDRKFLDHLDEVAQHFRDVDVEHNILPNRTGLSGSTYPFLGRTKYNPTNGGQHDLGASGRTNYGYEHYKGLGLSDHYFLTGDALSKDVLAESYNYYHTWKILENYWGHYDVRTASKTLGPIMGQYLVTGDPNVKAEADHVISFLNTWQRKTSSRDPNGWMWMSDADDQSSAQTGITLLMMMDYMRDVPGAVNVTQNMLDACSAITSLSSGWWTGTYFNDWWNNNYGVNHATAGDFMASAGLGFCTKVSDNPAFVTIATTSLNNGIDQDTNNGNLKPYSEKTRYTPTLLYFLQTQNDIQPIVEATSGPDTTPPTTTASPAVGTYTSTQSVTFSCTDASGCEGVYFTVNGDTPIYPVSGTTTQYTVPITVASSRTIKWIARDTLGNQTATQTAAYTINPLAPPPGGAITLIRAEYK